MGTRLKYVRPRSKKTPYYLPQRGGYGYGLDPNQEGGYGNGQDPNQEGGFGFRKEFYEGLYKQRGGYGGGVNPNQEGGIVRRRFNPFDPFKSTGYGGSVNPNQYGGTGRMAPRAAAKAIKAAGNRRSTRGSDPLLNAREAKSVYDQFQKIIAAASKKPQAYKKKTTMKSNVFSSPRDVPTTSSPSSASLTSLRSRALSVTPVSTPIRGPTPSPLTTLSRGSHSRSPVFSTPTSSVSMPSPPSSSGSSAYSSARKRKRSENRAKREASDMYEHFDQVKKKPMSRNLHSMVSGWKLHGKEVGKERNGSAAAVRRVFALMGEIEAEDHNSYFRKLLNSGEEVDVDDFRKVMIGAAKDYQPVTASPRPSPGSQRGTGLYKKNQRGGVVPVAAAAAAPVVVPALTAGGKAAAAIIASAVTGVAVDEGIEFIRKKYKQRKAKKKKSSQGEDYDEVDEYDG